MDLLVTTLLFLGCTCAMAQTNSSDARQPPDLQEAYRRDVTNTYYSGGDSIVLPCRATGIPTPSYFWLQNGVPLDTSRRNIIKGTGGDVTITKATSGEEGMYQCVVNNTWGVAYSAIFTKIMTRFDANSGQRMLKQEVRRGDFVKLAPSHIPSTPASNATWWVKFANDIRKQLTPTNRLIEDDTGALYITNVEEADSQRIFISYLSNELLGATKCGDETHIRFTNQEESVPTKPILQYPAGSEPVVVLVGEELRLQCIFSGPDVQVTWPGHMTAQREQSGSRIIIRDISREAAGSYTCVGRNEYGETWHTIKVNVQARPEFKLSGRPLKHTKTEGDDVTLVCDVTADPPASVEWFRNGESLSAGRLAPRTKISTDGRTLSITKLRRAEDIAVIQCNASNVHGYVYTNAALNVIVRTVLTEGLTDKVLDVDTEWVTMSCRGTTDPSTPLTTSWNRDSRPPLYYDDPRIVVEGHQLTLNLTGLREVQKVSYKGKYQCVVSNGYSRDQSTAHLTFNSTYIPPRPAVADAGPSMWLLVMVIVAGLCLIIIIGVTIACYRARANRGGKYPVGMLERQHGLDALVEVEEEGFHVYQRPTPKLARMDSICSSDDSGTWSTTPRKTSTPSLSHMRSGLKPIFTFTLPHRSRKQIEVI